MKRVIAIQSMLLTGMALVATGCGTAPAQDAPMTWEEFRANEVVHVTDESSPINGLFLVERDMTFESEADVRAYFDAIMAVPPESSNPDIGETGSYLKQALIGPNTPARWSSSQAQNLSYCVDNKALNYNAIVHALDLATHDWENYANVKFVHQPSQDGKCNASNTAVLFRVVEDFNTPFVAASFFPPPISTRAQRVLVVNTPSVPPEDTLPGVIRHELGHTMGFVHEHTNTNLCGESGPVRNLTPFDRKSVMMYRFCGGQMPRGMPLSTFDKRGVCIAYPGRGACAAL